MADDDEWAPFERPDEISMAEVDKVKDKSIKSDISVRYASARSAK